MVYAHRICEAIIMDEPEKVREYVQLPGFDPHETLSEGVTMMHIAASSGSVEIGKILRDAGVPLNEVDGAGTDVLSYAKRHIQFLEFLSESGVDLKRDVSPRGRGCTLLRECVVGGLAETVQYLIGKGLIPSEDDVKFAKNYVESCFALPKSDLVELLCVIADLPAKDETMAQRVPYMRIVKLFEDARASQGLAIGLKDADSKFTRGPRPETPQNPGAKNRIR